MSFYCSKGSTWLHPWLLCRQCHRLDDASPLVSINRALRFFEQHPPKQNMALAWCSSLASSRAPNMSSFSHIADARRVCASNKDSFLCPDLYSCSFKHHFPGHLVPVETRVEETVGGLLVWLCHTLGYSIVEIWYAVSLVTDWTGEWIYWHSLFRDRFSCLCWSTPRPGGTRLDLGAL